MNHDVSHCLDYDEKKCPADCYRAKVTKDLKDSNYPWPVSFVHFKGTVYCEATYPARERREP